MANKTLYCAGCSIRIAIILEGISLIKGFVGLCGDCNRKRIVSDLANKTKTPSYPEGFDDIFGEIFGGKK
jgi:hypothetical protein